MGVSQTLSLIQSGQSTEENYSKVRILWKSTQTGQSYNSVERTAKYYVSINGGAETEYSVKYTLPKGATQTIVDATITVQHDDKGSATIKVRTWMDTHISASVVEMSKSLDLTPIPRASTIGASDAFIEANTTIVVARRNADFRHSISYAFGDLAGYITPDGSIADTEIIFDAPSVSWAIPFSFYKQISDTPSGVCTLRCTTYSGNKVVGEPQTAQFRITANPASCSPGAAGNVVDVNPKTVALTGDASKMVRFASDAKCTINGTLVFMGASITKVEIDGVHAGDSSGVERIIENIETNSVEIRVMDSRGYTGSKKLEFELIPYVRLTNHSEATRVDPGTGISVLTVKGNCYNGSFGAKSNTLTIKYSVDNGEQTAVEAILDGNTYTAVVEIDGLDYTTGHTMEVIVSDALDTVPKTVEIGASIPVWYHGKDFVRFNVPVEFRTGTAAELSKQLKTWAALGMNAVRLYDTYEVSQKIPIPAGMTIIGGTFVATEDFEDAIFSTLGDGVRLVNVTMAAPSHNKIPAIYAGNNTATNALCSNVMGLFSDGKDGIEMIDCVCKNIIPGKFNHGSATMRGCKIIDTPMFAWASNCRLTAIDNDVTICDTGLDYYYHCYYIGGNSELLSINNHIRCDVSTPFFDVYHLLTAGNDGTYRTAGIVKGDVIEGNFQHIIDAHYADLVLENCTIRNTNSEAWTEFANTAHSRFAYHDCTLDYANASEQTYDSSMSEWVRYDNCRITKNARLNRRAVYRGCRIEQALYASGMFANYIDAINCEFRVSGTPQCIGIISSGTLVSTFVGNVVRFLDPNSSVYLFNYAAIDGVIANNVIEGAASGTRLWYADRGSSVNNTINGGAV